MHLLPVSQDFSVSNFSLYHLPSFIQFICIYVLYTLNVVYNSVDKTKKWKKNGLSLTYLSLEKLAEAKSNSKAADKTEYKGLTFNEKNISTYPLIRVEIS